jgi:hypothetical protein
VTNSTVGYVVEETKAPPTKQDVRIAVVDGKRMAILSIGKGSLMPSPVIDRPSITFKKFWP